MATTAKPIDFLVTGMRDTTGAVVASGKVRWYNPGTLVAAVAYSDAACTTPITAPLTLNAGGQGTIYCLEPVRVIVKDSTETTTYYDAIAPLNRHDSVYITHPSYNSGAETTLEAVLTTLAGLGQYTESATATARSLTTWLGEFVVSVKDFGALGDGSTDDTTAGQAASDRVKTRGGGWVYWPKGTYKTSSPITIDTAGVNHFGAGRGVSVIKNFSTSGNAFTINLGSSLDAKITFRDFSITANTTSSGVGVQVTNGNRIKLDGVAVALHRSGIVASAVTEAKILNCIVESTDDNAAAIGINVGTRGRVLDCDIISGTTNGTGITLGADARAADCYVEKFATGVSLGGAGAQARSVLVASATTGFSVGAFASCMTTFCRASSCTTDLSVNASATLFDDRGSTFTGTVTNSAASPAIMPLRLAARTLSVATSTYTPNIAGGMNINRILWAGAGTTMTLAVHSTATLAVGDVLWLVVTNTTGSTMDWVFSAQMSDPQGGALGGAAATALGVNATRTMVFLWDGSLFRLISMSTDQAT